MAKTTPAVQSGYLEWHIAGELHRIAVGTPAWFAWLAEHTTFAYRTPDGSVTVRRDRSERGGWYWRAYRRRAGRLQRIYLGAAAALTPARLQEAAAALLAPAGGQADEHTGHAHSRDEAPDPTRAPATRTPPQPAPAPSFLAARSHPPEDGRPLLARPALLSGLDDRARARLTLLVAPAGFGKTTLLGQWYRAARSRGRPVAWLSIEREDNDLRQFWAAILTALRSVYPGFAEPVRADLTPGSTRPVDSAVIDLLNDLAAVPHDLTLIVDDYQRVTSPHVHESLADFVARLPRRVHLVVASRCRPPWPIGRLAAAGDLAELRAADLCLSPAEAARFLRDCLQRELPPDTVAALSALTEGWIGGLQLAAEALRDRPGLTVDRLPLSSSHHQIGAFFAEEVLQGLPPATQTFVLETADLDRLSGPLCHAVTGNPASDQLLAALAHDHLFLTPLDDAPGWYRYHPFFGAFLREQLARSMPERHATLCRAAMDWFVQAGLPAEAIAYAVAGGLTTEAAQLLEIHGAGRLLCHERHALRTWLDAVPEPLVRARPRLLLLLLTTLMLDARWDCVEPYLRGAAADTFSGDTVESSILRALAALMAGSADDAEAALGAARQPQMADDPFLTCLLSLLDGACAWVRGDHAQARALLAGVQVPGLARSGRQIALLAIAHQAHFDAVAGRLETAILRYRQVVDQADADDAHPAARGMAALGLAQLHYERNELDLALEAASRAVELARGWGNQALGAPAALARARVLIARGDRAAAARAVELMEQEVRRGAMRGGELVCLALARAELALARDEVAVAASWLDGVAGECRHLPPWGLREQVERLQARVILLRGDAAEALALLQPLLLAAEERGRVTSRLPLLALQACAVEMLGRRRQTIVLLRQALRQGASGPFVRSMTDVGATLTPLLSAIDPTTPEEERYRALLYAAAAEQRRAAQRERPGPESLRDREHTVLLLVAAGASNREIAEQLAVTESTVKKYLSDIFEKLGVTRRTQAVAEARARGLL